MATPSNPIIFLDIDGVLNNHSFSDESQSSSILPPCVVRLNRILIETGARIVLCSAWRYMILGKAMTISGFDYLLRTHGVLSGRLIGHTPADEDVTDRGWQIQGWLDANGYSVNHSYVVIDDLDCKIHPQVQPHGDVGLTDADADKAIAILKGGS